LPQVPRLYGLVESLAGVLGGLPHRRRFHDLALAEARNVSLLRAPRRLPRAVASRVLTSVSLICSTSHDELQRRQLALVLGLASSLGPAMRHRLQGYNGATISICLELGCRRALLRPNPFP